MSSGGFFATHVAPDDGLQAWAEPDPAGAVVATVQPGVRMQLMEQRGAWGRVLFSNGWSGWVDARRLVAVPAPQPPPQAAPPFRPAPAPELSQPAPTAAGAAPATAAQVAPPAAAPAQPGLEDDPFQFPPQDRPAATVAPSSAETTEWALAPAPDQDRAERPTPEQSEPAKQAEPERRRSAGRRRERPERKAEAEVEAPPPQAGAGGSTLALPGFKLSPAPIGALVVLLGSLLSWFHVREFSGNAFRVPLSFLVDYKTTGGSLKLGLLLVAAAVVAGVFCVLPGRVNVRRIMGGVVILVAVVYVIELQRRLSWIGDPRPSLFAAVRIGVPIVIAGGIAILIDKTEPPPGA